MSAPAVFRRCAAGVVLAWLAVGWVPAAATTPDVVPDVAPPPVALEALTDGASLTLQPADAVDDPWPDGLAPPGAASATVAGVGRWRAALRHDTALPASRWIAIEGWRLEEALLWRRGADGRWALEERLDLRSPVHRRAIQASRPVLPVAGDGRARVDWLLELRGRGVRPQVQAWTPAGFEDDERRRMAGAGAAAAAGLALVLVLLIMDPGRRLPLWVAALSVGAALEQGLAGSLWLDGVSAPVLAWAAALLLLGQWQVFEDLRPTDPPAPAAHRVWRWLWALPAALMGAAGVLSLPGAANLAAADRLQDLALLGAGLLLLAWPAGGTRGWAGRWRWPVAEERRLAAALLACWALQVLAWPGWPGAVPAAARDVLPLAGGGLALVILALRRRARRQEATRWQAELAARDERHLRELRQAVETRTSELRQAMFVAEAAHRGKSEFLARVGHDLRSPLAAITGYAQLLEAEPGRAGRHARVIRRSAAHMLQLINDLIEYARGSSSDQLVEVPVYLHAVLDAVAHDARMLAAVHGNRFALRLEDPLPAVVVTDAKRLRQVLGNLLDNAAKYTRQGLIDLTVHGEPAPGEGRLMLRLQVTDTGVGMGPTDQARAFEPFYRGPGAQARPGSGLGLPIVKAWVQRMGGEVQLRSAPGVGTEVTVTLPLTLGRESDLAPGARVEVPVRLPELDGQGRRLWVVEDTPEILRLLSEELESCGFHVRAANDGVQVLERVADADEIAPDLVLTDFLMPGADGVAVLQAVRRRWPDVPVVLLSATPQGMSEATQHGPAFDATLLKPVDLGVLRLTLSRVLAQRASRPGHPPIGPAPDSTSGPPDEEADAAVRRDVVGADAAADGVDPPAPRPWATLPPVHRDSLRLLVSMGAMSDIVDWGERLAAADPALRPSGQWVADRAADADLRTIRRWMGPEGAAL